LAFEIILQIPIISPRVKELKKQVLLNKTTLQWMERASSCRHATEDVRQAPDVIATSIIFVVWRRKSWSSWWVWLVILNVELESLLCIRGDHGAGVLECTLARAGADPGSEFRIKTRPGTGVKFSVFSREG